MKRIWKHGDWLGPSSATGLSFFLIIRFSLAHENIQQKNLHSKIFGLWNLWFLSPYLLSVQPYLVPTSSSAQTWKVIPMHSNSVTARIYNYSSFTEVKTLLMYLIVFGTYTKRSFGWG